MSHPQVDTIQDIVILDLKTKTKTMIKNHHHHLHLVNGKKLRKKGDLIRFFGEGWSEEREETKTVNNENKQVETVYNKVASFVGALIPPEWRDVDDKNSKVHF